MESSNNKKMNNIIAKTFQVLLKTVIKSYSKLPLNQNMISAYHKECLAEESDLKFHGFTPIMLEERYISKSQLKEIKVYSLRR